MPQVRVKRPNDPLVGLCHGLVSVIRACVKMSVRVLASGAQIGPLVPVIVLVLLRFSLWVLYSYDKKKTTVTLNKRKKIFLCPGTLSFNNW